MYQKSAKKRVKQDRALEVESILSSQQLAEDNVEYIKFQYNWTDVYIWSSRSLAETMMGIDKSFLHKTFEQISNCSEQQEETYALSANNRPMNERIKGLDDEELISLANDNLKILLETIEINNITSRVENRFDINDKVPVEEVKKYNRFL